MKRLVQIETLKDGDRFVLPRCGVEGELVSKSVGCCTVKILTEANKPRVQWSLGAIVEVEDADPR